MSFKTENIQLESVSCVCVISYVSQAAANVQLYALHLNYDPKYHLETYFSDYFSSKFDLWPLSDLESDP